MTFHFPRVSSAIYLPFALALLISCSSQTHKTSGNIQALNIAKHACQNVQEESSSTPLDPNDIQLISWNVFKGNIEGWQADLHKLSNDKSIVLIQEAPLLALEETLSSPPNKNNLLWQFAPGYIARKVQTGVMTFSTSQANSRCYLKHKEPWLRSPKATLVTTYSIKNSTAKLLVANMHGINFTLRTSAYRKQLQDLQEIIATHTGPVIVAGDFNTWSKRRNRVIGEILNELNLTKVVFDTTYEKKFFGYPLDHVFSRGLEVKSTKVYQLKTSDHNPIQVNFKIPNS